MDYSPTLGAIAQELRAVGKRPDGMKAHPALQLTPADYATQVNGGRALLGVPAARSAQTGSGR